MAETFTEAQTRHTLELQQLLTEQVPDIDVSIGTVLYDLVVKPAAATYASQDVDLQTFRDNLSLLQVLNAQDPDPIQVDLLLSNFNVTRRTGTRATGLINVFVTTQQNVFIAADTNILCGSVMMKPVRNYVLVNGAITAENTDTQAYVQTREFAEGVWVASILATTVDNMETVLSAGQQCTIETSNTFITRVEVGSTFVGGQANETTLQLLERAQTNVNAQVVTGRDNIRSFLINSTDTGIVTLDAQVFGMGDELQLRDAVNNGGISAGGHVDIYVSTAVVPISVEDTLPGTRDDDGVWSIEIPAATYPGAYGVDRIRHGNNVITDITPILGFAPEGTVPLMERPIHARYSKYQTLVVEFEDDTISPDITEMDFITSILYMPGVATLQDLMNDVDVRSYSFDTMIKAVIPIITSIHVTLEYVSGITPPSVEVLREEIASIINIKPMGTEALYSSDVVYACKLAFPSANVRMPVNLFGKVYLPDGSTAYSTDQNHLRVAPDEGISSENTKFFCFPSLIDVSLNELPS